MTKFDDPAGRVKIQTRVKIPHQLHILLHTKTCNKLFIAQLLYFKDIFQKVGKATQIEKCTTRSQPTKQVFSKYKITKCTTSEEIFTRLARYLYLAQLNNNEQLLDKVEHNIINYQC